MWLRFIRLRRCSGQITTPNLDIASSFIPDFLVKFPILDITHWSSKLAEKIHRI